MVSSSQSLASRLSQALQQFPAEVLLQDDCGQWTGKELEARLQPLVSYFEKTTLPGSRIGVCFPNWAVQGFAILAVCLARRVPVILSSTEVQSQPERWLLKSHLSLLLVEDSADFLTNLVPTLALQRDFSFVPEQTSLSFRLLDVGTLPPRGTALILYTSGSTGQPKGICVPEDGLLVTADYLISYFQLNSKSVSPLVLPVCHSMALNTQFIPTFLAGGKSVFVNSRLSMNKIYRTILNSQGTFVSLIGEVLRACLEEQQYRKLPPAHHVRHVQLAGGMILPQHIQMAKELFPSATIHKGYGLTEAIRVTMINHLEPGFESAVVGKALPFNQIEIRDNDGQILPSPQVGQVYVKGPNVMRPTDETTGAIGEDGFLRTGDIGFINEAGYLTVMGRADSVFKINGLRVSGIEIEQMAHGISPMVRDVKCICVADERRSGSKIVLFLEIHPDQQETFFRDHFKDFQSELWKKARSLSYFPREIVVLHRFPRTANGKIQIQGFHTLWERSHYQSLNVEKNINLKFFKAFESMAAY